MLFLETFGMLHNHLGDLLLMVIHITFLTHVEAEIEATTYT